MTTHFIIKENIAQNKVNIILNMLNSWNIDVEVSKIETPANEVSIPSFSTGLWTDYNIDDQSLRNKAWGTHKRAVQ